MQKSSKAKIIATGIAIVLILMIGGIQFLRDTAEDGTAPEASRQESAAQESVQQTESDGHMENREEPQVQDFYYAMWGDKPLTDGYTAQELYEQAFACVEDGDARDLFYIRDGILYYDQYAETGEYDAEGLAVYEWRKNQVIAENVIYVDYNAYSYGGNAVYITEDQVLHGTGRYKDILMADVKFARVYADAMLALKNDGTLWCRGRIHSLSDGRDLNYSNWEQVLDDVAYASLGHYLYFAIRTDGSLFMWGDNSYGVFGDGCLLSPVNNEKEGSGFQPETCFYTQPVKVADGIKMAWYGVPGKQYDSYVSMNEPYSARMWFLTESDNLFVCGEKINDEKRIFDYFGEMGSVPEGVEINATGKIHPVISRKGERLTGEELESLNIAYEEFVIPGLKKEYSIFYLADSHISLCDERDPDVKEKAVKRQAAFVDEHGTEASVTFEKLIKASNMLESDMLILGGDILDSAMYASVDSVRETLTISEAPYLYNVGNHDFEYGSEYFSEKAWSTYLPRLEEMRSGSDRYMDEWERRTGQGHQVMEYEDLIILSVDDKNNQLDENCADQLEYLSGKGKPVIVVTHVPFEPLTGDTSLLQKTIDVWKADGEGESRVLIGETGVELNADTMRFRDLMLAQDSPVKLVLGGHIHFYHKDSLNDKVTQIVTGAAYQKNAVFIRLKPEN